MGGRGIFLFFLGFLRDTKGALKGQALRRISRKEGASTSGPTAQQTEYVYQR